MRLNRNRLRNMILREMRSMNEQTYNPTVTITVNASDGGFNIDGLGGSDYAGNVEELYDLIENIKIDPDDDGPIFNVFPDLFSGYSGYPVRGDQLHAFETIRKVQKIMLKTFREG